MAVGGESGTVLRLFLCFTIFVDVLPVSYTSLEGEEIGKFWDSKYRMLYDTTSYKKSLESNSQNIYDISHEETNFYEFSRKRRQANSAEELKTLVEDIVKDVAAKVERDYPIALYGSKCSSLVTVYNGCLGNTPDIAPDPSYSVPVSMTTSNVHFSGEAEAVFYATKHNEELNRTLQNSLCVSEKLDVLWTSNVQLDGYTVKWQQFIDSSTGYTRIYPGVNQNEMNCKEKYDPRLQSWYVSMVSPPKDVAIVIDVTMETSIELMKKAASAVINTLTKNDNAGIFMSSKANDTSTRLPLTKATASQRQTWLIEANDLQITPKSDDLGTTVSMAMEGLNSHFKKQGTSGSCVRVMVLITDRTVPISVLHGINNVNSDRLDTRVFTYTLGQNADDPVSKQISCDNNGVWFMLQNASDIHLISRYYQLLSPAEHLPDIMWSEMHPFRYENTTGVSGCLPATNNSNTILDDIGVACVYLENTVFDEFTDGKQVLSDMVTSTTRGCPIRLFSEFDLLELRPKESQCDRPISRTARELRDFAENAVKAVARRAEINYQISFNTEDCFFSKDIYDTCRFLPPNLDFEKEFGRQVTMETATLHLTRAMEQMLSQNATLEDFRLNKELYTSVCMSNSLDEHWQTFVGDNRDIQWQFYGDQRDRFLRIYPGIEDTEEECSLKGSEAPFRTWFPSAASSPKDVIIIVDPNNKDQLPLMQEAIISLVNTLTRYDFANIINSGKALYRGMVKTTNQVRQEMIKLARNLNTTNSRNVIGSFQTAKTSWEYGMNGGNASRCVEAVLFLTDSILPDKLLQDLQNIIKRIDRFRVFTYSIGPLADQTNSWQLACQNKGIWTHFKTVYDIWAHISDYYNYFNSNEPTTDVIWSEVYEDRYGLGSILSGCLPVYNTQSKHLTLLGVVCVDIMEKTLNSFHDAKEIYDSMMGGSRRCPSVQLSEIQIEELRTGDAKCTRQVITNAKQLQQYTEDALRRLTDLAHSNYQSIITPEIVSCPFDDEVHEVCHSSPPEKTVRPEVTYPKYILGDSTVLLSVEDSDELDDDMKNLAPENPLFTTLCLSESFVTSWNSYAQVAYHYFIGDKLETTCTRVFPDVVFGKDLNLCDSKKRDERILRIQKETDINSRFSPRDVMIVIQNTDFTTLNLMKTTIHTLTKEMTPTDKVGMVTTGGSHHDNQMEFFTQKNEQDFLNFIQEISYTRETRTLEETLQEAFYVLTENSQNCLPVMVILTDDILDVDLIELFEAFSQKLNTTVFVYLYGNAGNVEDTKQTAMEIACANNGAWDIIKSESAAVDNIENYAKFLPSDLSKVKSPVWFEMTSDLLLPSIQSNPMVGCMPVVVDGNFIGTLCDTIAKDKFTQYNDSSQVLHSLPNNTLQCMRTYLSKEEQSHLRRNGVKCGTPRPRGMEPAGIAGLVIGIAGFIALLVVLAYVLYKHKDLVERKISNAFRSVRRSRARPDDSDYMDGSFLLVSEDEDRYY